MDKAELIVKELMDKYNDPSLLSKIAECLSAQLRRLAILKILEDKRQ
jgi:hypothetical protein